MLRRSSCILIALSTFACDCGLNRKQALEALNRSKVGEPVTYALTLTGPGFSTCEALTTSELPRLVPSVRAVTALEKAGYVVLQDTTNGEKVIGGVRGVPYCNAQITEKGRRETSWKIEKPSYDPVNDFTYQTATVTVGDVKIEVTGIPTRLKDADPSITPVEFMTWVEWRPIGRILDLRRDTLAYTGTLQRFDDGWRLTESKEREPF